MDNSMYEGVTGEDYKALDLIFKNFLAEAVPHTAGHPELEEVFADFITKVGVQTQAILQKHSNDNHVKGLEVEDYKNQLFLMKQKLAKIEMLILPVSKACNKLVNNINDAKEKSKA